MRALGSILKRNSRFLSPMARRNRKYLLHRIWEFGYLVYVDDDFVFLFLNARQLTGGYDFSTDELCRARIVCSRAHLHDGNVVRS